VATKDYHLSNTCWKFLELYKDNIDGLKSGLLSDKSNPFVGSIKPYGFYALL
jgi:hypothetical protein